ncbi:hypothetical protein JHK82_049407 [Glycine max]|nr:hypothetical protein JHK82_049407 [Glycine max]KAG5093715.1 hypothetical protein JHK84_049303 [Glycine max]
MPQHTEFIDVADSDFLSNKELDDEDSEFETEFEKYFVYSTAKNRFFGQKRSLRVILGSGLKSNLQVTVTLGAVSVLHYWLTAATLIYMSATYSQITKHLQFSIA